ncbi:MAG: methyltransferase domain-containing protein [Lachnospiraceae bacterium]|nr:methyltransferase domain-containing protein [Lachnospiraceae bacterium]
MTGRRYMYTTGEFAKMANVSERTIRFYDIKGLLKPSAQTEAGYRLYSDADFVKLQRILTLKYLGFSLEEIADITVRDTDAGYVRHSLALQKELVGRKIEGLSRVAQTLDQTIEHLDEGEAVDWERVLNLIHMINMEESVAKQYKNGSNLNIRIKLHEDYSVNKTGWFTWIFDRMQPTAGKSILEIGCGNGQLWRKALERNDGALIGSRVVLSDISRGMTEEAAGSIGNAQGFEYATFDASAIPYPDDSFDIVVANHVMFYVKDPGKALAQVKRVLKPGGRFICSTYGRDHMKEITQLCREFDSRISLSEVELYENFGLETAQTRLERYFGSVDKKLYEDELRVTEVLPLVDYIMSCHGNQHDFINERYGEFKEFLSRKMRGSRYIRITKSAGMFICTP